MNSINIDIDELLDNNLTLEDYIILYCLYHKNKFLLEKYTKKCKKIDTEVFHELQLKGLIKIAKNNGTLYYELLSLTDKGSHTVNLVNKDFKSLKSDGNLNAENGFASFRSIYPKTVKRGSHTRRLHLDLPRCEKLYNKLLLETSHNTLCEAAKNYYEEHIKRNSEYFMQSLPTWLQQKTYLTYIDKIDETDTVTNLEAI